MNIQTRNERIKNLRKKRVPVAEVAKKYKISEGRVSQIAPQRAVLPKAERGFVDYKRPKDRLNKNTTNWWDMALLFFFAGWIAYLIGRSVWG